MVGELKKDPERTHDKGPVILYLESNNEFKGQTNKRIKVTHKVIVWGEKAELCLNKLKKHDKIYMEGIIQYNSFEFTIKDSNGKPILVDNKEYKVKKTVTEIKLISLNFL